jgi:hypothetical protein
VVAVVYWAKGNKEASTSGSSVEQVSNMEDGITHLSKSYNTPYRLQKCAKQIAGRILIWRNSFES